MSLTPARNYRYLFVIACLYFIVTASGQVLPDPARIQSAKKTEQEALEKQDQKLLAEVYFQYGKAYAVGGDFLTAYDYFIKSLAILEPLGDSFEVGRLYLWMSDSEGQRQHPDKSLQYALHAEQVFKRIGSEDGLTRIYAKLGGIYMSRFLESRKQQPFEQALYYFNKTKSLAYSRKDTLAIADIHRDFGHLFNYRAHYQDALFHLKKARDFYRKLGRPDYEFFAVVYMLKAYNGLNQLIPAAEAMQEAYKLYSGTPAPSFNMQLSLERGFLDYYQKSGKWKEAYLTLTRLRQIEVNKFSAQSDSLIKRLHAEFETQKKETELALTQRNLKLQTGFIVALLVMFAGAIGTGIVFFRLYRKNRRISAINASLVKEQNHRVKNNLQVMASMLHLQSRQLPEESARQALSDSRLRVQYMAMVQQKLYEEEHLAGMNLQAFIPELADMVLAACGYPDIDTEFSIEEIYLPPDQAIPMGMIVNELVTNSCKYAFPYRETPVLKIECTTVAKDRLRLVIADNGRQEEDPYTDSLNGKNGHTVWISDIGIRNSFGMELIRMQAGQLEADWQFSHPNADPASGLVFTMEFTI